MLGSMMQHTNPTVRIFPSTKTASRTSPALPRSSMTSAELISQKDGNRNTSLTKKKNSSPHRKKTSSPRLSTSTAEVINPCSRSSLVLAVMISFLTAVCIPPVSAEEHSRRTDQIVLCAKVRQTPGFPGKAVYRSYVFCRRGTPSLPLHSGSLLRDLRYGRDSMHRSSFRAHSSVHGISPSVRAYLSCSASASRPLLC